MRQDLLLTEPVPHPLLCTARAPLLRVLLRETPSSFRALLWGGAAGPPAAGAAIEARLAKLSLSAERRRLRALSRIALGRAAQHRAARLERLLGRLLDRNAAALCLSSIPLLDDGFVIDLPHGPELVRLGREVLAANTALAAFDALDPRAAPTRVALRKAVFAYVLGCQAFLARHDPQNPLRGAPRRVDFSGRSVVIPDPSLGLDQCGLPISMAVELFRLHLTGELLRRGLAGTIHEARGFLIDQEPCVLAILEELSAERAVLLSAGRCLSRHGMQAYFPVLTEAKAIALSPIARDRLFCASEGTEVKVYLPLGERAQEEACQRMMSPWTIAAPEARGPRLDLSADAKLGLYLASLEQPPAEDQGQKSRRLFSSFMEVERAWETGALSLGAPIVVRHRGVSLTTTAGRCLLMALLPEEVPCALVNTTLDRKAIAGLIAASVEALGGARAARLVEAIEALGLRLVTTRGFSLCLDDMAVPDAKQAIVEEAWQRVSAVSTDYEEGLITDGERYNKIIDLWSFAGDQVGEAMRRSLDLRANPLALLAEAGVGPSLRELRALSAMKGLMAKPSGEIMEVPITASLREGLSPHAYFATTLGARAGRVKARHAAREGARIAEALLRALGHERITENDCGALGAMTMRSLAGAGELFVPLEDRVRGRLAAETGELLVGAALDREIGRSLEEIPIRSPIFCEAREGICAACYGLGTAASGLPEIGEPVGLHAAHALSSRLEDITSRTFHICLCAAAYAGGDRGCDGSGDPFFRPSLADHDGELRWVDLFEGVTVQVRIDPITGHSRATVVNLDGYSELRPRLTVAGEGGAVLQIIGLESGHVILAENGQRVSRGEVVAKRSIFAGHLPSAMEGRPDLQNLLHARTTRPALLCEIGGVVEISEEPYGPRTVTVRPTQGTPEIIALGRRSYTLPRARYPLVQDGDLVSAGAPLAEGAADPGEITRILGPARGALFMIDQLQLIYALFGVVIDVRHAELVARALLRCVRIAARGDGPWAPGELVLRRRFERERDALLRRGLSPPSAMVVVTGLAVRATA